MDDEGSASPRVSEWGAHMMIKARLCDLVDLFSHPTSHVSIHQPLSAEKRKLLSL